MFLDIKSRIRRNVRKKMLEISKEIKDEQGNAGAHRDERLQKLAEIDAALKQPKIPKEVWVEILKTLAVLGVMGLAIAYDANGRVLPKTVEKWIPGPRL